MRGRGHPIHSPDARGGHHEATIHQVVDRAPEAYELLEAAVRSGRNDWARALTAERLSLRETSVYGWIQRARVLRAAGDSAGTSDALERADTYQSRFAAALTG